MAADGLIELIREAENEWWTANPKGEERARHYIVAAMRSNLDVVLADLNASDPEGFRKSVLRLLREAAI